MPRCLWSLPPTSWTGFFYWCQHLASSPALPGPHDHLLPLQLPTCMCVSLCVCMVCGHTCVYMGECMDVEVPGYCYVSSWLSSHLICWSRVSELHPELTDSGNLVASCSEHPYASVCPLLCLLYIYVATQDLNSDPYACKASTLPAQLSPSPLFIRFYICSLSLACRAGL